MQLTISMGSLILFSLYIYIVLQLVCVCVCVCVCMCVCVCVCVRTVNIKRDYFKAVHQSNECKGRAAADKDDDIKNQVVWRTVAGRRHMCGGGRIRFDQLLGRKCKFGCKEGLWPTQQNFLRTYSWSRVIFAQLRSAHTCTRLTVRAS